MDIKRMRLGANSVATIDLETLPDGAKQIVKASDDPFVLEAEATMLEHLRPHLRVPEVLEQTPGRLVLEYIPNDAVCNGHCEEEIADALARLHSIPAQGVFGFGSDTTIGPFRQRNRPRIRWVDFYREMRVLDFAARAFDEGKLAFIGMFNTFGERFYARYREHRRIDAEFFAVRADLYRLFPYLVHVRAFGGSYLGGLEAILRKVGY